MYIHPISQKIVLRIYPARHWLLVRGYFDVFGNTITTYHSLLIAPWLSPKRRTASRQSSAGKPSISSNSFSALESRHSPKPNPNPGDEQVETRKISSWSDSCWCNSAAISKIRDIKIYGRLREWILGDILTRTFPPNKYRVYPRN